MARYDGKTALLVVDMQNDFADPEGSLYVAGGEDGYSGFSVRDPESGRSSSWRPRPSCWPEKK